MKELSGKELWKALEKKARKKYEKDDTWELTMADNQGRGMYLIRLNQKDGGVTNGFVDMRE